MKQDDELQKSTVCLNPNTNFQKQDIICFLIPEGEITNIKNRIIQLQLYTEVRNSSEK